MKHSFALAILASAITQLWGCGSDSAGQPEDTSDPSSAGSVESVETLVKFVTTAFDDGINGTCATQKNSPEGLCKTGTVGISLQNYDPIVDGYVPFPNKTGCSIYQWSRNGANLTPKASGGCERLDIDKIPDFWKYGEYDDAATFGKTGIKFFGDKFQRGSGYSEEWTPAEVFGAGTKEWLSGKYEVRAKFWYCDTYDTTLANGCKSVLLTTNFTIK